MIRNLIAVWACMLALPSAAATYRYDGEAVASFDYFLRAIWLGGDDPIYTGLQYRDPVDLEVTFDQPIDRNGYYTSSGSGIGIGATPVGATAALVYDGYAEVDVTSYFDIVFSTDSFGRIFEWEMYLQAGSIDFSRLISTNVQDSFSGYYEYQVMGCNTGDPECYGAIGDWSYVDGVEPGEWVDVNAVPLPSSAALMSVALFGLGVVRRKSRST